MQEKKEIDHRFLWLIVEWLSKAPEGHIESRLRAEVRDFQGDDGILFDYLVEISKQSCHRTSTFVKQLCALDKYYERPKYASDSRADL